MAASAGASRKIRHTLGLNSKGKPKKPCFPCTDIQKELYKTAKAEILKEKKDNDEILATEERKRKATLQLEDQRSKSTSKLLKSGAPGLKVAIQAFGSSAAISKADVDTAWARFFHGEGVKPLKAESALFKEALQKSLRYGICYKPPNRNALNGPLLDFEATRLKLSVLGRLDATKKKFGVSCVSDGWSDAKRRPLLNILMVTSAGVYFHKTKHCNGETKDKGWVARFVEQAVKSLPCDEEDVITVVLDGANRFSFPLIEELCPGLECQWCSAHVLSLLLKDFSKVAWISQVFLCVCACFFLVSHFHSTFLV